jgi:hypothetical protein
VFTVTPILVEPGLWSIYYTGNPAHNWNSPDTFSNGQVVATLERSLGQFSIYLTNWIDAGADSIQSSAPFMLGGRTINLRELAPRGLVHVTSGSTIAIIGSPQPSQVYAASGYALVAAR